MKKIINVILRGRIVISNCSSTIDTVVLFFNVLFESFEHHKLTSVYCIWDEIKNLSSRYFKILTHKKKII